MHSKINDPMHQSTQKIFTRHKKINKYQKSTRQGIQKNFMHLNKSIKFCAFNGNKIARYQKLQSTKDPMQQVRKNIM